MAHVRSYLTSRVVATGAAVALLGGGAALADPASQAFEAQTTDGIVDDAADDEDVPGSDDEGPTSTEVDASSDDPESAPAPEEEVDQLTDTDMESDPQPSPEGQTGSTSDANDQPIPRDTTADNGERSETARAVHEALTRPHNLSPGDPGFGEAVSENARTSRGHGAAVSEAARGSSEDRAEGRGRPDAVGPPPHAGPPAHAGRDGAPGQEQGRESPPSHANDEDRVGPPDHAPARGFRAKGNDDANGTVDGDTNGAEGNDDE